MVGGWLLYCYLSREIYTIAESYRVVNTEVKVSLDSSFKEIKC